MQKLIEKYGISEMLDVNGQAVPVIDLPVMSDEQWNQLAARQKTQREGMMR